MMLFPQIGSARIPGPGCRAVATIRYVSDGVEVTNVDLYPPDPPPPAPRRRPMTMPGDWWGRFADAEAARQAIQASVLGNPVTIAIVPEE